MVYGGLVIGLLANLAARWRGGGFKLGLKSDGRLFFYAGRGDGTFKPAHQVGHGWKGLNLVAGADLNGDGIADICARTPDGFLNFYPGKGSGAFGKPVKLANP